MTCTSSRSCSHRTVSICLVQGRSAIPPLPNLSIAVCSEASSAPTIGAIFPSFLSSASWVHGGNAAKEQNNPHVFWYSSSKTNRFRVFVGDRCASMCCRFIFRQVCAILSDLRRHKRSCVFSMFLRRSSSSLSQSVWAAPSLKINTLTSRGAARLSLAGAPALGLRNAWRVESARNFLGTTWNPGLLLPVILLAGNWGRDCWKRKWTTI